ncbi:MAG: hypothetical protein MN733_12470, partial [Nitrososphaera sp.]|nr:hypothetical protein [Nitrososphaera sp.]
GVRDPQKDQERLKPIGDYYVRTFELAEGPPSENQESAKKLLNELKRRGKWPAKPDLIAWYGKKGSRWRDSTTGEFKRCVLLPNDAELLTRHEAHEAPPDVLVTNYSMLEYMLMRPLERPIFDRTREWLKSNPEESLLLVVDEAHLYRGAGGAEVALLIRRLRMRLGIPAERLQVICTSASFNDADYAAQFGAQLTGKKRTDFLTIKGDLYLRADEARGSRQDAELLSQIDLEQFYSAETHAARLHEFAPFLEYRGIKKPWDLSRSLYEALDTYPPMNFLINLTMKEARPVDTLGTEVFQNTEPQLAARAVTTLMALGSLARRVETEPSLLPCRVHAFFRGLPGLWLCMDPDCSELQETERGGPGGKLYCQPRDRCSCGARVLEFFTCRICGTAYARGYTDNIQEPDFLWAEPGGSFRAAWGVVSELEAIDLLLESPLTEEVEPAEFDLVTGRLNPPKLGLRNRQIYLRKNRSILSEDEHEDGSAWNYRAGEFRPCGVCGEYGSFGQTSIQDHQTKGDQPFQALITKQLQVQPPNSLASTKLAPLRGRKVLVFSDSRQTAARLAPNLQKYSTQDALRPLIVSGFSRLQVPALLRHLSLEDLY